MESFDFGFGLLTWTAKGLQPPQFYWPPCLITLTALTQTIIVFSFWKVNLAPEM